MPSIQQSAVLKIEQTESGMQLCSVSNSIESLTGYTSQQVQQQFSLLIQEAEQAQLIEDLAQAAQNNLPYQFKSFVEHLATKAAVTLNWHFIPGESNDLSQIWHVSVTVDESSHGQQQKSTASLLNFAVSNIHDVVYLIDQNANIKHANQRATDILGFSQQQLMQMTIKDIDHEIDDAFWKGTWEEVKQQGHMQLERYHTTKDGHQIPFEIRASYFEFQGSGYSLTVCKDISEQKKALHQLELLSYALNRQQDFVYLLDENSNFVYVNETACRRLGYSQEEMIGKMCLADIDPPYTGKFWEEHWATKDKQDTVQTLETTNITKTGEVIPLEVSSRFVKFNGIGYAFTVLRDITERKRTENELNRLSYSLNKVHYNIYLLDRDGNFCYVNDTACEVLGYRREELIGKMRIMDIDPDLTEKMWPLHWQQLKLLGSDTKEVTNITKAGTAIPFEVHANFTVFDGVEYSFAVLSDLTERKMAKQAQQRAQSLISEQEQRLRELAENIEEIVWLYDVGRNQLLYVNTAYEKILGLSIKAVSRNPFRWFKYVYKEDRRSVLRAIKVSLVAPRKFELEFRILKEDHELRYIHTRTIPIYENGRLSRLVGSVEDVTKRRLQEERIEYLAYHDALTGLPNRTYTLMRLAEVQRQCKADNLGLAVLYLDLDRFKVINDTLGHPIGDKLLTQVAIRVRNLLRDVDIIGRVGGDEFLILVPGISSENTAAKLCSSILDAIVKTFDVDKHALHIGASIGLSLYPKDALVAETLIKYADNALYWAKEQGRNTYRFFSREMDDRTHLHMRLENDLRQAISSEQLFLLYQPQWDVFAEKYTGIEALLRWNHPELGVVPPSEFIPIAEETGMIVAIGKWVLTEACQQAKKSWDMGYQYLKVAVNLSYKQLADDELMNSFKDILDLTACPVEALEIEVSESCFQYDAEMVTKKLQQLTELGLTVSLDGFGKEESRLISLQQLPIRRVKINRSFIHNIPENIEGMRVIQTSLLLAHQLGIQVLAEGVETASQKTILQELGCQQMQGFLFSKPTEWGEVLSQIEPERETRRLS